MDLEPRTVLLTLGMWLFIIILLWFVPYGFKGTGMKITMSISSLPLTYLMVYWQLNK